NGSRLTTSPPAHSSRCGGSASRRSTPTIQRQRHGGPRPETERLADCGYACRTDRSRESLIKPAAPSLTNQYRGFRLDQHPVGHAADQEHRSPLRPCDDMTMRSQPLSQKLPSNDGVLTKLSRRIDNLTVWEWWSKPLLAHCAQHRASVI